MVASGLYEGENLSGLELFAMWEVEGFITGLHKSPFHGFSVEFSEHRLYNPGDTIKHIDWKLYGKSEKLFSKRYVEETNLRCQFILDVSSSMYYPQKAESKLHFSIKCIASLIYLLKKQRDAFGLSLFSDKLMLSTPTKSTTVHQKLLISYLEELLAKDNKGVKTNISAALHLIADQIHKRSLVIVFSDLLETFSDDSSQNSLFDALQHLKYNKHEVLLFNVVDRESEVNFNFENRPYTFIDLESGQQVKAQPIQIKEAYHQRMNDFRTSIQQRSAQLKIDLIDADIQSGVKSVLESYLIKRRKLN